MFKIDVCRVVFKGILWKIPWTKDPGRLQSMGVTKSRTRLGTHTHADTRTLEMKTFLLF